MTIDETKKVLSFLWSCFPSAPRLSREDKDRMIISFFRVLYRYSQIDVINAVIDTCRGTNGFVPSVFDIEKHIRITPPDIEFLSNDRERYLYDKYKYTNVFGEIHTCNDEEEKKELSEYIDMYPDIQRRLNAARLEEERAYYSKNEADASKDIHQYLGVTHEKDTINIK